jgi:hypothetical protein
MKDSAWYPQGPSYATHFGGPANHRLHYLKSSLPCHANYYKWMRLQDPILGDSSRPIYHLVTKYTQGLSFVKGNATNIYGEGQGESPVIQPLDPVDMDDPI